jgi:site-specific recombinase XerD
MTGDTVPQEVEAWLIHLQQQGKSGHTVAAYRRALTHFAGWYRRVYGDSFNPGHVIARDVRDWKAHQQRVEKAAPGTLNQRLAALSRFFDWAVAGDVAKSDPTVEVKAIRPQHRKPNALSKQTLRRLLRAVHDGENLRDIAMVEVLAGTGIRVGELLELRVGDIQLSERSGALTVRYGKHAGYREVPLTRDVRQALEQYLAHHPHLGQPDAPLWFSPRGELRHRSSVLRMLNRYASRSGLEEIGPHQLRHTFATRYLDANRDDLRGLASLLGHSSLNTVMIYTEPSLDDLTERMERVESGDL